MAGKGIGKIFEEEIKGSFPSDFYIERYKDDTAGFYGVSNPADYRLYKYPYTFLLELKTHKGKSIPLDKIRDNQIKGMYKASQYKGIFAGFLINYRDLEETYYITVADMVAFISSTERKSVPVEWCRENGVRIVQTKKRVRYSYDLRSWLGRYYNEQFDK
jgi:recombination protein U